MRSDGWAVGRRTFAAGFASALASGRDASSATYVPTRQVGIALKPARDVRNGWGVNIPNDAATATRVAEALDFLGTRWVRLQLDGDRTAACALLQAALVRQAVPSDGLKLQLVLNGYLQGARRNSWAAQQRWILEGVLPIRRPDGRSILAAIEGPNELNSGNGGGSRGPDDTIDKTGGQLATSDNKVANRNFVDWARQLKAFRDANAQALRGVEILSPTVLYYYPMNWSSALDVSRYVDYGSFHYYAGLQGGGGVPSWPANPDNFARMYGFAQAGICPGKAMVQSEGGAASHAGGGYAADGRSGARYQLMQLLDHHAVGGHRYMVYDLFNHPRSTRSHVTRESEENYGLYFGDMADPKPAAIALHNLSNLLSLGNRFADRRNLSDTSPFSPAYSGDDLRISGLQSAGSAGQALVLPKSDGTTIIAVWNEPTIDTGSGISVRPPANPVSVEFGAVYDYNVYDPTGGGGLPDFTARATTTPITSGTGAGVQLTLFGIPLLIELKARR